MNQEVLPGEPLVEATSYDEVPYESYAFPQTHPAHTGVIAKLFGMAPPDVAHARVLELGAASGGNLIPMACQLPEAEFVGFDLSRKQVEQGKAVIQQLGLRNIRLERRDIMDIGEDVGQFDYIITHGVYSWVPEEVQDRILAISRERLTENGIAYVSYNTYPGWHMREMIRDMMVYHARQFPEPSTQVAQARALLDFLARYVPQGQGLQEAYATMLKSELELLKRQPDAYLYHEHLEEHNRPIYFHQFAERAAGHGLQYLGETDFASMLTMGFAPEVGQTLRNISKDLVRTEQYMDFLRNRAFRQTLLCRGEVPLNRNVRPEPIKGMYIASPLQPASPSPDIQGPTKETFRHPSGATLSTDRPITKAALAILGEMWPQALSFEELFHRAFARSLGQAPGITETPPSDAPEAQALAGDLLQCYLAKGIDVRLHPPQVTRVLSEHPEVSALVRWQAFQGQKVTTQWHQQIQLDPLSLQLLRQMDGGKGRGELIEAMVGLAQAGVLGVQEHGKQVTDPDRIRELVTQAAQNALERFRRMGLLVA